MRNVLLRVRCVLLVAVPLILAGCGAETGPRSAPPAGGETWDPRDQDLPIEVNTLIEIAADARVDLTTAAGAVEDGAEAMCLRQSRVRHGGGGYAVAMKLLRGAAALSAAKVVYDQARKPENQAKIKSAVAQAKASRARRQR